MNGTLRLLTRPWTYALGAGGILTLGGVAALVSCSDPTSKRGFAAVVGSPPASETDAGVAEASADPYLPFEGTVNEDCPAGSDWIPADGSPPPPVRMFTPPPHPDTECPFYRGAYENFLIATIPLGIILKVLLTGPSRIRALTERIMENPLFDRAGQHIGRAQMIRGLLYKTKKKRALALQHLTEAKRIFSQFGQTPILARVETALAELGQS